MFHVKHTGGSSFVRWICCFLFHVKQRQRRCREKNTALTWCGSGPLQIRLFCLGLYLRWLNRRLIDQADDEKRNDADQPFEVNDVRQEMDFREKLPGEEADNTNQGRPEGCVFTAQGRTEHGSQENQGKGRCQGEADEHDLDNPDGVKGQPEGA